MCGGLKHGVGDQGEEVAVTRSPRRAEDPVHPRTQDRYTIAWYAERVVQLARDLLCSAPPPLPTTSLCIAPTPTLLLVPFCQPPIHHTSLSSIQIS